MSEAAVETPELGARVEAQEANSSFPWVGCFEQVWPPELPFPKSSVGRSCLISVGCCHYQDSIWVKACQVCSVTLFSPAQGQFAGESGVGGRRWASPSGSTSTACPSPALVLQGSPEDPPLAITMGLCLALFEVTFPAYPTSQKKLVLWRITSLLPLPRKHSEFLS